MTHTSRDQQTMVDHGLLFQLDEEDIFSNDSFLEELDQPKSGCHGNDLSGKGIKSGETSTFASPQGILPAGKGVQAFTFKSKTSPEIPLPPQLQGGQRTTGIFRNTDGQSHASTRTGQSVFTSTAAASSAPSSLLNASRITPKPSSGPPITSIPQCEKSSAGTSHLQRVSSAAIRSAPQDGYPSLRSVAGYGPKVQPKGLLPQGKGDSITRVQPGSNVSVPQSKTGHLGQGQPVHTANQTCEIPGQPVQNQRLRPCTNTNTTPQGNSSVMRTPQSVATTHASSLPSSGSSITPGRGSATYTPRPASNAPSQHQRLSPEQRGGSYNTPGGSSSCGGSFSTPLPTAVHTPRPASNTPSQHQRFSPEQRGGSYNTPGGSSSRGGSFSTPLPTAVHTPRPASNTPSQHQRFSPEQRGGSYNTPGGSSCRGGSFSTPVGSSNRGGYTHQTRTPNQHSAVTPVGRGGPGGRYTPTPGPHSRQRPTPIGRQTHTPQRQTTTTPSSSRPVLTPRVAQLCSGPATTAGPGSVHTGARKFPGPAGLLPKLHPGQKPRATTEAVKQDEAHTDLPQKEQEEQEDAALVGDFEHGAWFRMKEELGLTDGRSKSVYQQNSIALVLRKASLKQLTRHKVSHLCVMIKIISLNTRDATVTLCDPSGEMLGTIHRRLVEERQGDLRQGAVLVLRQVGVLSPTQRNHYLNITPSNVVQVFTAEGSLSQPRPRSQGSPSTRRRSRETSGQEQAEGTPPEKVPASSMDTPTLRDNPHSGDSAVVEPGNAPIGSTTAVEGCDDAFNEEWIDDAELWIEMEDDDIEDELLMEQGALESPPGQCSKTSEQTAEQNGHHSVPHGKTTTPSGSGRHQSTHGSSLLPSSSLRTIETQSTKSMPSSTPSSSSALSAGNPKAPPAHREGSGQAPKLTGVAATGSKPWAGQAGGPVRACLRDISGHQANAGPKVAGPTSKGHSAVSHQTEENISELLDGLEDELFDDF